MTAIKHLLAMKIKDVLQAACIDALPEDDLSRVDLVAIRSAGSQITGKRLVMVVKHMDPLDPMGSTDATVGDRLKGHTAGSWFPNAEFVGQGVATFEVIRGVVEIPANLTITKEDSEQADEYIQEALARAKHALRKNTSVFMQLKDDYGEAVKQFTVIGTTEFDSGGDNSNLSRFFIRWLATTETGSYK